MNEESASWEVEWIDPDTDVDDVLAVSANAFHRPLTRRELESEIGHPDRAWILVIRPAGSGHSRPPVIGYCWTWRIFDELHINSLAVAPGWRQRGAASRLLAFALDAAAKVGATRATLEVRRSNTAARRLYERFGFVVRGTRRDYYTAPPDDALILWREAETGPLETPRTV